MSIYLLIYDLTSLVFAFLATALYFGVLAAYGRLTGRDLSRSEEHTSELQSPS